MNYAILDIETTSGDFNAEKITEIAIYKFDGKEIVDTFISLVNPQKDIPIFVQKLTGITNKMVRTAPKFPEIAKRLIEITEGTTIVAHNSDFDYRVIQNEFRWLGYNFERPTIDTVTLGQLLIPNMESYSLGKLCDELKIPITDRHRASGDARATVHLFKILLDKDKEKKIIKAQSSNTQYPLNKKVLKILEDLPQSQGIVYFQNSKGEIIHLERSKNIANTANQLLTKDSIHSLNLQINTEHIHFDLTGTDLISIIKEYNELEANKQLYSKPKKVSLGKFGVFDKQGKLIAGAMKYEKRAPLVYCHSLSQATRILKSEQTNFSIPQTSTLIIEEGRNIGEKSFILLEKGVLLGYGYYSLHYQIKDLNIIKNIMISATSNSDIDNLIKSTLFIPKKEVTLKEF